MQESPGFKPDLLEEIIFLKLFKHSVMSESFKYVAKHWKKRNHSVVFSTLMILFLMQWHYIDFCHSSVKVSWF